MLKFCSWISSNWKEVFLRLTFNVWFELRACIQLIYSIPFNLLNQFLYFFQQSPSIRNALNILVLYRRNNIVGNREKLRSFQLYIITCSTIVTIIMSNYLFIHSVAYAYVFLLCFHPCHSNDCYSRCNFFFIFIFISFFIFSFLFLSRVSFRIITTTKL